MITVPYLKTGKSIVLETRFNLTHDRSASRFHDIMAVVETLKNCGPDDRDHYLLTKSSRVHRLRKSQTYRDVFKMSRMEIMKRVHEADPEVCGTVKPLGNRHKDILLFIKRNLYL